MTNKQLTIIQNIGEYIFEITNEYKEILCFETIAKILMIIIEYYYIEYK